MLDASKKYRSNMLRIVVYGIRCINDRCTWESHSV